jgi:hypothetical protein
MGYDGGGARLQLSCIKFKMKKEKQKKTKIIMNDG